MPLPLSFLRTFQSSSPQEAWRKIFDHVWQECFPSLQTASVEKEIVRRDREVAMIDLVLSTAGWDLWKHYENCIEHTADALVSWWQSHPKGKAILILDALSLREVPWILEGAKKYGYTVHQAKATGAELPADTLSFARALGFAQRSSLENNGAGASHKLAGAYTDSISSSWKDCMGFVPSQPDCVFWHSWPDDRVHDFSVPGEGLVSLVKESARQLGSEDFWNFIARLTTGRKLVLTSDHGYAASGYFPDTTEEKQTDYLKARFKSGRFSPLLHDCGSWVPPIDLVLETSHGKNAYVLGCRKWKSSGGYPTLVHGGLSILEVAVPFIEISRY